eukprot:COSAG04_NODE_283_length_18154_cov_432.957020_5_plen_406_part_00
MLSKSGMTSATYDRWPVARAGQSHLAAAMEIIENALSTSADSDAKLEIELAADTDAVTSAVPWEQRKIGELMSNADGGPSPLFRGVQLVAALVAILVPIVRVDGYAAEAGMEQGPNELLWLTMIVFACAFWLILLALRSARVALRPGGPLEDLGAGEQKISASGAKSLGRWRVGLWAVSALFALGHGGVFVAQGLTGTRIGQTSAIPAAERVYMVLIVLEVMTVAPILFVGWWASMGTACCICRDKATEVIRSVRDISPAADGDQGGWDKNVVEPTLALCDSMETLSAGWGSGLLGMSGGLLLSALARFVLAINADYCNGVDAAEGFGRGTTRHMQLSQSALYLAMALLLARDLASATSRCDLLRAQINLVDIKHGAEHHQKIDWLFVTLQRLASPSPSPPAPQR